MPSNLNLENSDLNSMSADKQQNKTSNAKYNKKLGVTRRKSYTILFKRIVLKYYETTKSINKTHKNLKVGRASIKRWIVNKELIMSKSTRLNKRKLCDVLKKKAPHHPEAEEKLVKWYKELRSNDIRVDSLSLQNRMRELVQEINPDNKFLSSYGWLRRFMARHNLVLRRICGTGCLPPKNCAEKIDSYLNLVKAKISDYQPNEIFNFDESSFYMDMPGNYTIETRGIKRAFCKSTGQEKTRLSCLFMASANGDKLPVLCVVPRKKKIDDLEKNDNCLTIYETGGTFNSQNLTEHFVDRILKPHLLKNQLKKSLIILDHARPHITSQFQNALKSINCEVIFIPPRLTSNFFKISFE